MFSRDFLDHNYLKIQSSHFLVRFWDEIDLQASVELIAPLYFLNLYFRHLTAPPLPLSLFFFPLTNLRPSCNHCWSGFAGF